LAKFYFAPTQTKLRSFVPKKAVAIFFLLAFLGAAIFVYFTFPRTKEEIPTSNNQRPFPSAPMPTPNVPNGVPVPETVPHPNTPKVPPGPTLHVMAWASAPEAQVMEAETDAFSAATGRRASLTIDADEASYRSDLQQALASGSAPDVCLITARDFSGLDPAHDLADMTPIAGTAPRSQVAFTVDGHSKAAPDEFSVDVLFYNPSYFDQAGIGYPDRHWNWDILEADARALDSLKLKDPTGQPIFPLELPANFDFWNILCTQAGHAALDQNVWHLSGEDEKESQMRALDFIQEIFQHLSITAPPPKAGAPAGSLFAQQKAALLIAPSELAVMLPQFPYAFTLLPEDMQRASLARVNGWAVMSRSTDPDAARALAGYLAWQPVHAGWTSVQKPSDENSRDGICYEALGQALIPRIEPKSAHMAQFLDQQIDLLARNGQQKTDELYARIQSEYQGEMLPSDGEAPDPNRQQPAPKVEGTQLRGL
jgi:ABC-type glycerol-3-phosphate transport system substrate-binding protein